MMLFIPHPLKKYIKISAFPLFDKLFVFFVIFYLIILGFYYTFEVYSGVNLIFFRRIAMADNNDLKDFLEAANAGNCHECTTRIFSGQQSGL